jgi:hypothetical protein
MNEIIDRGPVVAEFALYEDFLFYKSGVYQHTTGKLYGYYYAKILGWGRDKNTGSVCKGARRQKLESICRQQKN